MAMGEEGPPGAGREGVAPTAAPTRANGWKPRPAPMRSALLVAFVALLAGCSGGGDPETATPTPVPTGPPPPPPPPSEGSVVAKVNDTWSYQAPNKTLVSTVTGANATHVRLRTDTEQAGFQPRTTITIFDARTLAVISIRDDFLAGGVELRFEPPLPILVPAADHEYNGSIVAPSPFGGEIRQPASATIRFLGLENVTVPAGTFEAYRYNATLRSTGLVDVHDETEIWFAPKVEQAVRTVRNGEVQELVSYRLG